ncbi:MAG: endonuclease/exonuclease/phosphatase family protein [Porphyromonas sp.]|nr:endonuclease/exonuclease/phosphatase family protein [Porphyromonas sp.]
MRKNYIGGIVSICLLSAFMALSLKAQPTGKKSGKYFSVAFYNLENLFDTINQPRVNDEEFTPNGKNKWDQKRYEQKLKNMSQAISYIGGMGGPDILGLAEIENRGVLEDLVKMPAIAEKGYDIVHYDSPDARGIDCALLYRKEMFRVVRSEIKPVVLPNEEYIKTRDMLHVEMLHEGETFHFIVGHWPSRSGGEQISLKRRMAAALVMREISDSIVAASPEAKVVLMGDFNDDPVSPSVVEGLRALPSVDELKQPSDLFSPMYALYKDGYGTLAYQDAWNLFDMLMVNKNAIFGTASAPDGFTVYADPDKGYRAFIVNSSLLTEPSGLHKGYPHRTFVSGKYEGGYSDHFPVYLYFIKRGTDQ